MGEGLHCPPNGTHHVGAGVPGTLHALQAAHPAAQQQVWAMLFGAFSTRPMPVPGESRCNGA
eukprot:4245956-Amphidinium_carterae.1